MDRSGLNLALCAVLTAVVAAGCDPLPKREVVNSFMSPDLAPAVLQNFTQKAMAVHTPNLARVTKRKANLDGKVLILEYHKLSGKNTELDRTPSRFLKDLELLYKTGYRPVTVTEWLDDKMPLPPGASPVIMTFDDAHESQFVLKHDGTVSSNCFVGIWKKFAEKHPDFPVHGTFFILPPYPFGQIKMIDQKVKMLKEMGSEVASHTYHHYNMSKLSDDKAKEEIATSLDWLAQRFGVTETTLAFPYGNKPKNMKIMQGFEYKGKHYSVRCSFLAAGNPAPMPTDKSFDIWRVPRVVACEGVYGMQYWVETMKKPGRFAPYVAP